MISFGLERRLAVIATAALTLAIWALPASAARLAEAQARTVAGCLATDGSRTSAPLSGMWVLRCEMLYRNKHYR
jgi:hypothetical protein